MAGTAIKKALCKSLLSWAGSDTALLWLWAFCFAGAVTLYEIFLNSESQHPGAKFWTDRVPGYFTVTLVFTGVTFGLSRLSPHLRGWLGIFVTAVLVSVLFTLLVSGPDSHHWWKQLIFGRNALVLTTLYLLPPYLVATLLHWRERHSD